VCTQVVAPWEKEKEFGFWEEEDKRKL